MKTKKLIKLLQDNDPSGELECTVNGIDIYSVARQPGHFDGAYEILVRDESRTNYNIVGAKITSESEKIILEPLSIKEAISEDPKLPVEFDSRVREEDKKLVEEWRKITE